MKMPRLAFAAALLTCASAALAQKAPDYDDGTGTTPPARGVQLPPNCSGHRILSEREAKELTALTDRLLPSMPRRVGETEDDRRERTTNLAFCQLEAGWKAREAAAAGTPLNRAQLRAMQPEPTGGVTSRQLAVESFKVQQQGIAEDRAQTQRESEERRIAANTAPGQQTFQQVYRSSIPSNTPWSERTKDLHEQHGLWCRNNPEPCAREQRRIAAQEVAATQEQRRREQWQVMHIRQRLCQPLPEWIQGVNTPQEALAYIQQRDPDADIDARSDAQIVTILTSREPVNLAHSYPACVAAFRMIGR